MMSAGLSWRTDSVAFDHRGHVVVSNHRLSRRHSQQALDNLVCPRLTYAGHQVFAASFLDTLERLERVEQGFNSLRAYARNGFQL